MILTLVAMHRHPQQRNTAGRPGLYGKRCAGLVSSLLDKLYSQCGHTFLSLTFVLKHPASSEFAILFFPYHIARYSSVLADRVWVHNYHSSRMNMTLKFVVLLMIVGKHVIVVLDLSKMLMLYVVRTECLLHAYFLR